MDIKIGYDFKKYRYVLIAGRFKIILPNFMHKFLL